MTDRDTDRATDRQPTDRLSQPLELRSSVLLDIDAAGRLLIRNDDSGSMQLQEVSARRHAHRAHQVDRAVQRPIPAWLAHGRRLHR